MREPGFKEGIEQWWSSRTVYGTSSSRLATKLMDFWGHLFKLHRQIRSDRTRRRDVALAHIQALDEIEDSGPLQVSEAQERRSCLDEVAEMDLRYEMDWPQRSRQIWLATGDADTLFFTNSPIADDGRIRSNAFGKGIGHLETKSRLGRPLWHIFRIFTDMGLRIG